MKKRSNKKPAILTVLLLVITAIVYTACESILFIELEEADNLIVVNGTITSDREVALQVSRTRHILDNAPIVPLENASVLLYQDGSLAEELVYTDNGYFRSVSFIPSIGETYTVEVKHEGYNSVTARSEIPEPVRIRKLDTATVTVDYVNEYDYGYSERAFQFDLTLNDPVGEENYYLLFAEADRSWTEYRDTTVKVVDSLYYGNQWNYFLVDSSYIIFDIHRFTDFPYISTEDIVVEAMTSHGVLFSDQLIEGKSYSFRGYFYESQLEASDSAVLDIRLLSISESYYKYLKSRQNHSAMNGL